MDEEFSSFSSSIGLSKSQSRDLKSRFYEALCHGSPPREILDIACQAAQESLGTEQVDSPPINQTLVNENWSLTCVSTPHCIILPRDTNDVAKSIKIISYFKIKFAVRSGGHSPNPGWSSVGQDGILLDLQRLNQVSLSSDKTVCSLGPGGRWGDVIAKLGAQNATVVGARNPLVGVGGYILGGGYSHLSPEFGTAADNVKNFEVVLGDGTVVNANAEENNDLFWALKGGGPNFGVVTRFDLFTVPVNEIWYQLAVYSPAQAFELLDTFAQWQQREGSRDFRANIVLGLGMDSHVIALIYSAPANQTPSAFAPFSALEPLQLIIPPTNGHFCPAKRGTRCFHSHGTLTTFVLQHVPSNLAAQGIAKGGNPMCIPQETHQWWTTLVDWTEEEDDDAARSVSIDTVEQWKKLGQEHGLFLPFLFMNDGARNQSPLAGYGSENLEKLKRISLKYDGGQLFQTHQNGGFLLSRV
ncbi:hypothetical protein DL769_005092 [Monosporascus sp. CRB-8-3]|nr:hypothetical protein DL769_005092 [Monosporascus sp. CRB-8-3]